MRHSGQSRPPRSRRLRMGAAALVVAAGAAGARAEDPFDPGPAPGAAKAAVPGEITAFVRRLAGCHRLAAEGGDEPERAAEIASTSFRLRCNTVEQDEGRLRARFSRSPAALDALDRADDGGD